MEKKYVLQDVKEPQLYEEMFRYDMIPKIIFDNEVAKFSPAEDFWITCTTFRDGQQARPPYTVEQIVELYKFMHRLGGPNGVIRQCEFFLYSDKDKKAVEECLKLGYRYPEITGWIRAKKEDFKLVKQMGLKETGILTSASDYHIFLKLNKSRQEAMRDYLEVVDAALAEGIIPRCHLEDATRADFYGFVIPFVQELMQRAEESKIPIKIRACDTLGYGVPYPSATIPRSVPKLIRGLIEEGGVPPERLEWHGHNDFHKVLINAEVAWLYGCSAANGTLLGFGERTGNPPIEGLIIEYVALKGDCNGVDTTVITEIGDYFKKALKEPIPKNYPFVGDEFNVTRAGIHADGGIKNEMIYNIFDTRKLLNRPMGVGITDKSGIAGIVYWIDNFFGLKGKEAIDKQNPGAQKINEWVTNEYKNQRITSISDQEMIELTKKYLPDLFVSELEALKSKAKDLAHELIWDVVKEAEIMSMEPERQEPILQQVADNNPFIKLIYITNAAGRKITKNITQKKDSELYRQKLQEYGDLSDRPWFKEAMGQKKVYFSDLYTSKVTGLLCITVSAPILDKNSNILGVLGIDIKFDDLI
ncbi:MAG: histone-lysine N-methyltransferase [Omnitrophica WOR_2 bacterium RBG_13_44_8b]|nr:MAG: histone-lysine N-methyltransferase [Omnitrophica WOR_2 bacterium RBG_13_44_8b]